MNPSPDPHARPKPSPELPVVESSSVVGGRAALARNEQVLSTLESDGSRRWLHPSLATGRLWRRRRIIGYVLIVIFVAIPHLRIGGRPLIMLDIPARQFTIMGHTFLPTDTLLLALAMVGVFVLIAFVTAVGGRLWCGWACPQTVYMEFVFRPIDRLFEGTRGRGGKPRKSISPPMQLLRFAIYLALSMLLAHTFLAYFVGTDRLAQWIRSSPTEHPFAFLVMFGTTGAMLFDFMYFREQMCVLACPYGRFQSVMLDPKSMIVGYDFGRGEPRGKKKKHTTEQAEPTGDCVACNRCVVVCPTGIDIRNGLQMECINCAQCIDACNDVMRKVDRPEGLIRYTSEDSLHGKSSGMLRARTVLYPVVLAAIAIAFVIILSTKYSFDASILRTTGNRFSRGTNGELINSLNLRLVNRSNQRQQYTVTSADPKEATVTVMEENGLTLDPGESARIPLLVKIPRRFAPLGGSLPASLTITDSTGSEKTVGYQLLGPSN